MLHATSSLSHEHLADQSTCGMAKACTALHSISRLCKKLGCVQHTSYGVLHIQERHAGDTGTDGSLAVKNVKATGDGTPALGHCQASLGVLASAQGEPGQAREALQGTYTLKGSLGSLVSVTLKVTFDILCTRPMTLRHGRGVSRSLRTWFLHAAQKYTCTIRRARAGRACPVKAP